MENHRNPSLLGPLGSLKQFPGKPGHQQGEGGRALQGEEGPPEDGGGGEGHLCPEAETWGAGCEVPGPVPTGAAGGAGPRHCGGGRPEVAGRGAGEVLEEGAAGSHPGQAVRPQGLQIWLLQDGLIGREENLAGREEILTFFT